ncbi:transporter [Photobacterium aquae]|uniref:Transporter n=1 Tax=Photobacterium aquae TaxID=1195763 RepID=A0A0J1GWX0_9GAMM|nr:ComEA family DNA-binding protein [Photobacterium aquae]KLV03934.1 transporter [Photobacterium aquae]
MKQSLKGILLLLACLCYPGTAVLAAESSHEGIEITVNINDANAEELDELLVGIGPEKAQSIIEFRTQNGKFTSIEQLSEVKGIGPATVEKNRKRIQL